MKQIERSGFLVRLLKSPIPHLLLKYQSKCRGVHQEATFTRYESVPLDRISIFTAILIFKISAGPLSIALTVA